MPSLLRTAMLATVGAFAARRALRASRHLDVRGKVVLVTGGSRGLGLALARNLASQGARLALCARDAVELERVRAELAAAGAEVFVRTCDVTSETQMQSFVGDAVRALGPVDVLVANAATIQVGPLSAQTKAEFARAMDEIFWGAYYATNAVLPSMRERREGRIVHIASFGGKVAVPHLAPYSAAKFALVGLSTAMRAELAQEGILVTTVSPGLMRTGSHLNAEFKGDAAKEFSWFSLGLVARGLSMDADAAAGRIVAAMQDGDAELVLGVPAKLATLAHALAPNAVAEILAIVNRFGLPADSGSKETKRGAEVRDDAPLASVIHTLDPIAEKFHEVPGPSV